MYDRICYKVKKRKEYETREDKKKYGSPEPTRSNKRAQKAESKEDRYNPSPYDPLVNIKKSIEFRMGNKMTPYPFNEAPKTQKPPSPFFGLIKQDDASIGSIEQKDPLKDIKEPTTANTIKECRRKIERLEKELETEKKSLAEYRLEYDLLFTGDLSDEE